MHLKRFINLFFRSKRNIIFRGFKRFNCVRGRLRMLKRCRYGWITDPQIHTCNLRAKTRELRTEKLYIDQRTHGNVLRWLADYRGDGVLHVLDEARSRWTGREQRWDSRKS